MKLNLNRLDDWEDYLDDDEATIKKFPRENKGAKSYKNEAKLRKVRQEKMNARTQEESLNTWEED